MQQTKQQTKELAISYDALDAIKDLIWLSERYNQEHINTARFSVERELYYDAVAKLRLELGAVLDKD